MPYYVDGFVLTVPEKNLPAYKKLARLASKVFVEHGALEYCECVQDELEVPVGISFPELLKPKRGEVVVFAWIVYENKTQRNRTSKLVMEDPRMAQMCDDKKMPFDIKRMSWGGFKMMVEG